jgi:hypothetical protein
LDLASFPPSWYLGAFHAGRKSEVAKKPYNPILGEIFQCYWNLPSKGKESQGQAGTSTTQANDSSAPDNQSTANSTASSSKTSTSLPDGKLLSWVEDPNAVMFFAEQVSHHPPISAFYAEHLGKKISLNAHIWTKSKFLGLSIGKEQNRDTPLSVSASGGKGYNDYQVLFMKYALQESTTLDMHS